MNFGHNNEQTGYRPPADGYETIVLAGSNTDSRKVLGEDKIFLEIDGIPLIIHTLCALAQSDFIKRITVVGPREMLDKALLRYSACIAQNNRRRITIRTMEQRESLYRNVWHGFLYTIDGYRPGLESEQPALFDSTVFVLTGDLPLIGRGEIDEFLTNASLASADYVVGVCTEETLERYFPDESSGKPGVRMATLPMHEGKFRMNNLHLVKPFRMTHRENIDRIYHLRYQKEFLNIVMFALEMLVLHIGLKGLLLYLKCQLAFLLNNAGRRELAENLRKYIHLVDFERTAELFLGCRSKGCVTNYGGAAVDVDNEADYRAITARFGEWRAWQTIRPGSGAANSAGMIMPGMVFGEKSGASAGKSGISHQNAHPKPESQ